MIVMQVIISEDKLRDVDADNDLVLWVGVPDGYTLRALGEYVVTVTDFTAPEPGTDFIVESSAEFEDGKSRFRNFYRHCEVSWDDEWSCTCNDECPECGVEVEPFESESLKQE
jgi:hypothetical protein